MQKQSQRDLNPRCAPDPEDCSPQGASDAQPCTRGEIHGRAAQPSGKPGAADHRPAASGMRQLRDCAGSEDRRAHRESALQPFVSAFWYQRRHQACEASHYALQETAMVGETATPRGPSQREHAIIQLVAEGCKNREIANSLGTTEHVIKNYLRVIYDKLGLWNRVELALWYEARQHEQAYHA